MDEPLYVLTGRAKGYVFLCFARDGSVPIDTKQGIQALMEQLEEQFPDVDYRMHRAGTLHGMQNALQDIEDALVPAA